MAYNNSYTAVTGGTLSAAQWNTHVRDNFTAVFPYTTAGDITYATSSTTLQRLALGAQGALLNAGASAPAWLAPAAADALLTYDLSATSPAWLESSAGNALKYLRQNSSGNGFEWAAGGLKMYAVNQGGYTNSSSGSERDVPSSSVSVVVDVTSTIVIIGQITGFNPTGGRGYVITANFDGTNYGASTQYAGVVKNSNNISAIFTGQTAGTKTAKLRELHEFSDNYTVAGFNYVVFVIPE